MNRTAVILSTYNGKKFVSEQIRTIMSQSEPVDLYIRDDGSEDGTKELLNVISQGYAGRKVYLEFGDHVGIVDSYLSLIYSISSNYQFVAFSDQDDLWKPEKLQIGILKLESVGSSKPAIYGSNVIISDAHGYPKNTESSHKFPSFVGSLVENIIIGCTLIMNNKALEVVQRYRPNNSRNIIMHDWWIYSLISYLGGQIVFDRKAYIYYRQHEKNAVGVKTGLRKSYARLKRFRATQYRDLFKQAEELSHVPTAVEEFREELRVFMSLSNEDDLISRLSTLIRLGIRMQTISDTILLYLKFCALRS